MFSRALKPITTIMVHSGLNWKETKNLSTSHQRFFKVVIAGGSGGIGQPLALFMKMNPLVTELAIYDIVPMTPGVAVDLSHMNTPGKVTGHIGLGEIAAALKGADLVIITAGVPRTPAMVREDTFCTNAYVVRDIVKAIAENSPKAIINVITNPVNAMVPLVSELLKKAGVYDPRRIFGVTSVDVVRAATFVAEANGVDPRCVNVPVIGGHSGLSIIPVLSQSDPPLKFTDQDKIKKLTVRVQQAGGEVVDAKAGGGSATLSMSYAAARLANAIIKGLNGAADVVECTYVKSDVTEATYFANPILFGKNGVEKNLGYGKLNDYEQELLKIAIPSLQKNIQTGENFVLCKKQ